MLNDINLTDMETCYKAFVADCLRAIPMVSNRFGIEPELTAKAARNRLRIYEVPINYNGRTYEEGKSVGVMVWPRSGLFSNIALVPITPTPAKSLSTLWNRRRDSTNGCMKASLPFWARAWPSWVRPGQFEQAAETATRAVAHGLSRRLFDRTVRAMGLSTLPPRCGVGFDRAEAV
jgi:hypothetical protein